MHPPLGVPDTEPTFSPNERHLGSGERLILVTKGITERRTEGGGQFGLDRIKRAVEHVEVPTAAATAMAIQEAVTNSWREPLEDDGTVVVLAVG